MIWMFSVGEKIIYGENGVCTVECIAPLAGAAADSKLYYHLRPFIGSGTYFAPVDSGAYMRPVPAICNDTRFNHVDAFYKQLFKLHSCEALVSIVKGLRCRMTDKKTKSSRAEATMKRAKDILHGELAVALDMDVKEVEPYIINCIAQAKAES